MDKRPLVIGNWKMELSHKSAVEVCSAMKKLVQDKEYAAEIVVCPSYPSIPAIAAALKGTSIAVGAQNIHHEEKGPYTGSVSVSTLREFITWCIVGHSEVRYSQGDTDEMVVHKAKLLLSHGIRPVVCVGETQEQHAAGETISAVSAQVDVLLSSLDRVSLMKTAIAYEPIWAIGTGNIPEPNEVYEVLLLIRKRIAEKFDVELAQRIYLLYGGSVASSTVSPYIAGPGADGVLVGGASIHPRDFIDIVSKVAAAYAV